MSSSNTRLGTLWGVVLFAALAAPGPIANGAGEGRLVSPSHLRLEPASQAAAFVHDDILASAAPQREQKRRGGLVGRSRRGSPQWRRKDARETGPRTPRCKDLCKLSPF